MTQTQNSADSEAAPVSNLGDQTSTQLSAVLPPEVIAENIAQVQAQIALAAKRAQRNPAEVQLMLAAKYQPAENLRSAIAAGAKLFGHNLVQQLATAESEIVNLPHTTTMIGHVQSNKLTTAMQYASRIDTVDSLKTAERISRRQSARINAGEASGAFPILLQVNSSGAPSQFGCTPNSLIELAKRILELPNLQIQGLMTIGANTPDRAAVVESFQITQELSAQLRELPSLSQADVLSMGMTADLELAVEHGSTLVRVGRAVFGQRPQK